MTFENSLSDDAVVRAWPDHSRAASDESAPGRCRRLAVAAQTWPITPLFQGAVLYVATVQPESLGLSTNGAGWAALGLTTAWMIARLVQGFVLTKLGSPDDSAPRAALLRRRDVRRLAAQWQALDDR